MQDIPLHLDQINTSGFLKHVNYVYNSNIDVNLSELLPNGVNFFTNNPPKTGVIYFKNYWSNLLKLFDILPKDGSFILIGRDTDDNIDLSILNKIPKSVKKIYTTNCSIKTNEIVPIPLGVCLHKKSSQYFENILCKKLTNKIDKIYCCFTANNPERKRLLNSKSNEQFYTKIKTRLPIEDLYKGIHEHKFVASPQGVGKDCVRTYESIILGSIPLVSDSPEMRMFEDLPIIFVKNWEDVNYDWCMNNLNLMNARNVNTDRMRMSYWDKQIKESIRSFL